MKYSFRCIAVGFNHNGIWTGLVEPISSFDLNKSKLQITSSDGSVFIWEKRLNWRNSNLCGEVVIHCNQDDIDDLECNLGAPLLLKSQRLWVYETPDESFA